MCGVVAWFSTALLVLLLVITSGATSASTPSALMSALLLTSILSAGAWISGQQTDGRKNKKVAQAKVESQEAESLRLLEARLEARIGDRPLPRVETLLSGQVYLLKAGPFYKIGKSKNAEKRIKQIKLQLPYPVEVVHVITTTEYSSLERFYHRRFENKRTNGEWFLLTDEDVREFVSHS